jgi:type IV pilus assembly protein PilM
MHTLGLQFGKNGCRVALLRKEKKKKTIELLRALPSEVKPLYTLAPILSGKSTWLVTGLEAAEILLRQCTLKLTQRKALLKALPFQIETLVPFPLEEGIFLPFFQKKDEATDVTLFVAKREHVEKHCENLQNFEVCPDQVSCSPSALYRFARYVFPDREDLFLFHLGEEKSCYLCIQKGNLLLAQTLSLGRKQLSENESKAEKELQRMVAFLTQKFPATRHFLLTGDFPENSEERVKNALGPSFSFLIPSHSEYDPVTLQVYAVAIGLALEEEKGVQFCQGAHQAPQALKRQKRRLFSYFASCFVLTLGVWIGSFTLMNKSEDRLLQRLKHLSHIPLKGNLTQALEEWEKALQTKQPQFLHYVLNLPNVSDVLAWISAHPKLEGAEVKNVHYFLTKFPKIGAEQDPYEAKVDLEFTAPSPRQAREFHDALLAENEIVNSSLPISWNASQDSYSASFFLKKRAHP